MTTPDLSALLGPSAHAKPTPAASAAIRKAVLRARDQYPKTGMQSAPRCLDGVDPYAYAVHHGVVTVDEVRPFLVRWRDEESLNRGLGTGGPCASAWKDPYTGAPWKNKDGADIEVTVHDCQHETMQQYTTGAALLTDAVAFAQPGALSAAIHADPTLDPAKKVTNSRQLGRAMVAQAQEGSWNARQDVALLMGKVFAQMDTKDGQAFYTSNEKAGADHDKKPWSIQQESTILKGFALAYRVWPTEAIRDAIYHGIKMLDAAQQPDGSFANDVGPDGPDADTAADIFNPGKVMDLWCVPALIEAKAALGNLWPPKAQKVLDNARKLWLATDYTKPSDKNWGGHNVLSITLACAAEYGFRQ